MFYEFTVTFSREHVILRGLILFIRSTFSLSKRPSTYIRETARRDVVFVTVKASVCGSEINDVIPHRSPYTRVTTCDEIRRSLGRHLEFSYKSYVSGTPQRISRI